MPVSKRVLTLKVVVDVREDAFDCEPELVDVVAFEDIKNSIEYALLGGCQFGTVTITNLTCQTVKV